MPPTFPGSLSITAISLLILPWHIWAKKDSLTVDDSPQKGDDLVGARCWTNGNGLEAQWLEQGGTVDRGMFWYKCNAEGKLVPSGCLDGKRSRIPLGGTFISDGYLLECSLWGGLPRLSTVGCSPDGKQSFRIGQTWDQEQDQHWWRCVSEGMLVRPRPVGCLKGKRRLSIGGQFDDDNNKTTFECQHSQYGMPGLNAIGCITADGRHFRVGQQWKEGDFLFYCKRTVTEAGCQQTCIGCVSQNQTLFDGDRLTQNGSIFQCEVRPKRHALKPVACVSAGGVERVLDCKWRDQTLNGHRVERQCVLRAGRAVVDTLGCVFVKDGIARLFLRPGSYAIWRPSMDQQPIGVACREAADGGEPQLENFPQAETAEKTRGLTLDAEPKM